MINSFLVSNNITNGRENETWFCVLVVRQVAPDNVPLRNGSISYIKKDKKYPNKMIDCSGERFWNFIQGLKVASFMW